MAVIGISQKLTQFSSVLEAAAEEAAITGADNSEMAIEHFCQRVSQVCLALRAESRRVRGVSHDLCDICKRPLEPPVASVCCTCNTAIKAATGLPAPSFVKAYAACAMLVDAHKQGAPLDAAIALAKEATNGC